jgi:hypothetical protein
VLDVCTQEDFVGEQGHLVGRCTSRWRACPSCSKQNRGGYAADSSTGTLIGVRATRRCGSARSSR